ncbi:gag-pol polyprotein [Drepanopeziza brunnea f. sp. 'multigermtubi' MB_m1]|uniref:Gag-pol polyprotein n=1 Tax=Marssonina brunnea f. sp. multigermtubi (strain MB_m1) TaxID=1072389 RepID=K1WQ40_MARBU|nr:gag-pol polyprotein [Drepanopeziza brunnea f. sp. 'multigermtubi' MB_m1]EKD14517.1 gag-pol polyprotein [Drepanopeziza brunnea f. sp. 'multigermtubi' MB_m1]
MLQDKLDKRVLEYCEKPYRNQWFLIAKKQPGQYRLINLATLLNAIIRKDANLPLIVNEFAKEFSGCQMASLVDLYSGYDQQTLYQSNKDLTAFFTPLSLFRCTTLSQSAINSMAQFVRTINFILGPLQPKVSMLFVDDIKVKGLQTDYSDEEALSRYGLAMDRSAFESYTNATRCFDDGSGFDQDRLRRLKQGNSKDISANARLLLAKCNRLGTNPELRRKQNGITTLSNETWINLFDFKVRHVLDKDHTAADALSRRPRHPDDSSEEDENEFDDSLLADLRPIKARDGSEGLSTDPLIDIR